MKGNTPLTIASLIGVLLFSVHLTDDIIRGMAPGKLQDITAIVIMTVWLCGTVQLAGRRSGFIITLLGGLFAFAMPWLHMRGAGVGVGTKTAEYAGGFRFIWTLLAIGTAGLFSMVLSVQGLLALRSKRPK